MPVPKKRTSKSRRNKRRSHHMLEGRWGVVCPHCANFKLPHTVCTHCGYYNSLLPVIKIKVKEKNKNKGA